MKTQADRILQLLTERPEGVYVYELITPRPEGQGVAQYNARILELRRKGFDIRNDHPGHFYLNREPYQSSIFPVNPGNVQGDQSYRCG